MTAPQLRMGLSGAVFVTALAAGGWVLGRGFRVEPATGAGAKLFDAVLGMVAANYVDSVSTALLYQRASAGMVYELGDPHSVYLDSTRLARVQASVSGLIGQLGLDVDVRDGWVTVVAALPGAPAELAGLRAGDRLVTINGRSTLDWTVEEARRALRGNPGTSVVVMVERPGIAGRTELSLERETIYIRPVQRVTLLSRHIAYIALRTFSDSATSELRAAVDSLYRRDVRGLILDLRGNPGGLLDQGSAVANLFLDSGRTIVTLRGRLAESNREVKATTPQAWPDLRLAVLVDRSTASASEIVAGALQDHDRALLLGRRTYGKGSAQSVFSFRDMAGVKLTTSRWFTPSGRNIDLYYQPDSADGDVNDEAERQQVFTTSSGRKVYGGGGILPDVITGDSVTPRSYRRLFAAIGRNMRRYRETQAQAARAIASRGVSGPGFDVTPAMRDALYARLARAGVTVDRGVFDGAAEWVDRQLGAEVTRLAFGRNAEIFRLVSRDRVVQAAMTRLTSASSTRELLATGN
jgi:carboxyl-terminal processing protease